MSASQIPPTGDQSQPDDVDILFARLAPARVPPDLAAHVLERTVGASGARARLVQRWVWLVALSAGASLAVTGYLLGGEMAASGSLDLLLALAANGDLLVAMPSEVVGALEDTVPWAMVLLAAISAALLVWATGLVARPVGESRAPSGSLGTEAAA